MLRGRGAGCSEQGWHRNIFTILSGTIPAPCPAHPCKKNFASLSNLESSIVNGLKNEKFNQMEQRLNIQEKGQNALKVLFGIGGYLKKSPVEAELMDLICFRVSQINRCAYCLDMHYKDARAKGETEQRLYGLSAWRESPYYTDRERAAFALAEAVTACHVPDEVYTQAKAQFSDQELIDLTLGITTINTWNRLNHVFQNTPGTYQVGQY